MQLSKSILIIGMEDGYDYSVNVIAFGHDNVTPIFGIRIYKGMRCLNNIT